MNKKISVILKKTKFDNLKIKVVFHQHKKINFFKSFKIMSRRFHCQLCKQKIA